MKSLVMFLLPLLFASEKLMAQDVHFSQWYHNPVLINPAMTGNHNGLFRANLNYRNQWFTIPTIGSSAPYTTYSGSFDAVLFPYKTQENKLGAGINLFADKAGDGALTTYSAMGSLAYHKAADRYGKQHIAIGLQAGITQKRIDITKLFFEEQYDPSIFGFNESFDPGEANFSGEPIFYADVNLGVLWQSRPTDRFAYYIGFSLFHIAKPKETFLNDNTNVLDHRYVAHAGADIRLGDYASMSPAVIYMLQSNAQQFNIGTSFNYDIEDDFYVFAGAWYRVSDAVIGMAGFDYKGLKLGISYDVNVSNLRGASNGQGAFEIGLVYVHRNVSNQRIFYERYCPKF